MSAVIANSRSVNRSTATVSKLKSSALKSVAARLARMENANRTDRLTILTLKQLLMNNS